MLLLFIFFMVLVSNVHASGVSQEDILLELVPAWSGHFQPDKFTEIGLKLYSQADRKVSLLLTGIKVETRVSTSLKAGEEKTVYIPVIASGDTPVSARIIDDGANYPQKSKRLNPIQSNRMVLVLPDDDLFDHKINGLSELFFVLRTHANSFPRESHAFEVADILVINNNILTRLDSVQLQALYGHLMNCGKVAVAGVTSDIFSKLKQGAGCSGKYLSFIKDDLVTPDQLLTLLNFPISPLPSPENLDRLKSHVPDEFKLYDAIVYLFLSYIVILCITAFISNNTWPLILVILFTTALLLFATWWSNPGINQITWINMTSGNNSARFSTILEFNGNNNRSVTATLPASYSPPIPLTAADLHYVVEYTTLMAEKKMVIRNHLFSRNKYFFTGTEYFTPPVVVSLVNGTPEIRNLSQSKLTNGFLLWNDHWYQSSDLLPGDTWKANEPLAPDFSLPFQVHKSDLEASADPTLVLPYMPDSLDISNRHSSVGWLSISLEDYRVSE